MTSTWTSTWCLGCLTGRQHVQLVVLLARVTAVSLVHRTCVWVFCVISHAVVDVLYLTQVSWASPVDIHRTTCRRVGMVAVLESD